MRVKVKEQKRIQNNLFNCSCCINKGNSLFQNIYFLTCVSKHYLSFIMSIITVD